MLRLSCGQRLINTNECMKSRIYNNAVALIFVQIANYVVPLFVLFYLTSRLDVLHYGVLAFSQGVLAISAVIIDFGFGLSATEKISRNSGNKKYISSLIGGILIIQLCLFVASAAVVVFYAFSTVKYESYKLIFIVLLFPMLTQCLVPTWFFQGIEKMRGFAVASIVAKFSFAALVSFFVKTPEDYYLVPLLNGLSYVVVLIFSVKAIWDFGYLIKCPSVYFIKYCLGFTRGFFLSRLAVATYMGCAPVVLGLVGSPASVAVYSVAEQLYKAMQSAFSPIVQATYPFMVKEKNIKLMFKIIGGCISVSVIGAIAGYFLSPLIIAAFFSASWIESVPILNVFFVAIIVNTSAVMFGYPLAAALGRVYVANNSVVAGAVVYLFILLFAYWLDVVSPIAMAAIMVISEIFVFLYRAVFLLPLAVSRCKSVY